MINDQIIKLASNTKFQGLKRIYTHRSTAKNSVCGDFIKIELVADKFKIKSMRYETNSCVLCEASASLLSNNIKNTYLKDLKILLKDLKYIKKTKKIVFQSKLKILNKILDKKTLNRINCVILPMEALLKAIKIDK